MNFPHYLSYFKGTTYVTYGPQQRNPYIETPDGHHFYLLGDQVFTECVPNDHSVYSECKLADEYIAKLQGCHIDIKVKRHAPGTWNINPELGKMVNTEEKGSAETLCDVVKGMGTEQAIKTWWKHLVDFQHDPFWYEASSKEPLGPDGRIDVEVPLLKGRQGFADVPVTFVNGFRESRLTKMKDGVATIFVNEAEAGKWRGVVKVYANSTNVVNGFTTVSDDIDRTETPPLITGRLHKGKLTGIVRLFGHIAADKDSGCKSKDGLNSELMFVGRWVDGVATGEAWKVTFGAGAVYGRLDAEGQFTGDDIAYIYPDKELALVGKFDKTVMVRRFYPIF